MKDRAIKFMAWDGSRMLNRTLFDRNWYDSDDKCVRRAMPRDSNTLKIMQYIGIEDTKRTKEFPKGEPIYDGYVLKCKIQKGYDEKTQQPIYINKYSVIEWWQSACNLGYRLRDGKGKTMMLKGPNALWSMKCEIVGNIYANPDLLRPTAI